MLVVSILCGGGLPCALAGGPEAADRPDRTVLALALESTDDQVRQAVSTLMQNDALATLCSLAMTRQATHAAVTVPADLPAATRNALLTLESKGFLERLGERLPPCQGIAADKAVEVALAEVKRTFPPAERVEFTTGKLETFPAYYDVTVIRTRTTDECITLKAPGITIFSPGKYRYDTIANRRYVKVRVCRAQGKVMSVDAAEETRSVSKSVTM